MKKRYLTLILLSLLLTLSGCASPNTSSKKVSQPVKTIKVKKAQPARPAKTYAVTQTPWLIQRDGLSIYGVLYSPQNRRGKKAAVILAHGLAGNYHEMEKYAENLAKQGYLAYAFDFPGGAKNGQSMGVAQTQMSIFTEEANLKVVLTAIRNRSDVNRHRVSLLGESQGGAVSALLAAKYPQKISSLILLYPAFSISDYTQAAFKSPRRVPNSLDLFGFKVGKAYFTRLFNFNLLKAGTRYPGPVLIIHGSDDLIVPATYSEKASQKFKRAKLYILHHAGHDFSGKYEWQALQLIDRFMARR